MKKEGSRGRPTLNGRVASVARGLAELYREGADVGHTQHVHEKRRALVRIIMRDLRKLTYPVHYIDESLYVSSKHMAERVVADRALYIWTGASETVLWAPEINWRFRAWHDAFHHLTTGSSFDFLGELWAWRSAAAMTPQLAPLLFSEIVLQASVVAHTGEFAAQRLVEVPERIIQLALELIAVPNVPAERTPLTRSA